MKGLMGHAREIGLYSKSNGKGLKGFKKRTDIIIFIF